MRKGLNFTLALIISVGFANAAVRDGNSIDRNTNQSSARTAATTQRGTTARTGKNTISRTTTNSRGNNSTNVSRATTARAATTATTARSATTASARTSAARTASRAPARSNARAATMTAAESMTFGTGYNACRDAYFTCMDQFCAVQNETYRRCVCSSRLNSIISGESLLSQTATQLQDFKDLNIDIIPKTAGEVQAMLSASAGETAAATTKDASQSAQQLKNISTVLNSTKSKALSTAGTLDAGGDINEIWATTDLASGAYIANLTGEPLYNAVHAQCAEMAMPNCNSKSTLNMVVSAYGMYIENDCTTLTNSLNKKITSAKKSVRDTEREMQLARLENYNAHNSTAINECIAQVRNDLTANTACGTDYVHCLDISGKYLNRDTGEPLYTAEFYQLDGQISLEGNILTNQTNRLLVADLNRKRIFAERGLDTCRDIADVVWDEFMRQAIVEIYQGQQQRIRQVKTDCLEVVTKCYDEQNESLKDFSNVKEQLLLGQRLELSEEMCVEKLNACSNLYGGGSQGMKQLLTAMHDITDQTIAQNCMATLRDYAKDICAVPSSDTIHTYPYSCRVYSPGQQKYAHNNACNQKLWADENKSESGFQGFDQLPENNVTSNYTCDATVIKKYTTCNSEYYMAKSPQDLTPIDKPEDGNACIPCALLNTDQYVCNDQGYAVPPEYSPDDTPDSSDDINTEDCGDDYIGSLYQKLVRYALQACVRPSLSNDPDYIIPTTVLQDVNVVMDSIRIDMGNSLANECERLGGTWVPSEWVDKDTNNEHDITADTLNKDFYDETGANTKWGYCTATLAQTLRDQCTNLGGTWVAKTWLDKTENTTCCANNQCIEKDNPTDSPDGCHDITGDVLLNEFYSTQSETNTHIGYCASIVHTTSTQETP